MKYSHLILSLFFFAFASLTYAQEPTEMQQVIDIHDEVMERMPTLGKLIHKLKPLADTTEEGETYQKAIDDLKASNTTMINWMQGLGERFTADEMLKGKALSKEKEEWLIEERKKIEALKEQTNSSIQQAEKLL